MPQYFVTYDVQRTNPDPHKIILEQASSFGWYTFEKDYKGEYGVLPNTTLQGIFPDPSTALDKFFELINYSRDKNKGILIMEKYYVGEISWFAFASNERSGS